MCKSKLASAVNVQNTNYEFLDTITSSHVDTAEAGKAVDGSSSNDSPTNGI